MALVKLGAIVSDIRGTVGGAVFRKRGNTLCLGPKPRWHLFWEIGCGPLSWSYWRQNQQHFFPAAQSAWQALSVVQQNTWNTDALNHPRPNKIGDIINISGYNHFMSVNMILQYSQQAIITVPVAAAPVLTPPTFVITTLTTGALELTASGVVPAGYVCVVRSCRSLSASNNIPLRKMCVIAYYAAGSAAAMNVFAAYVARYGAPILGGTVQFDIVYYNITTGVSYSPKFLRGLVS